MKYVWLKIRKVVCHFATCMCSHKMTMMPSFIRTINIGANDGHDYNVQKTKESSLFLASLAICFIHYLHIANIIMILMYRKQKQRSPVYFLPPRLLCRKREIVNLFPLLGHSSKLLKQNYFQQNVLHLRTKQTQELLSLADQKLLLTASVIDPFEN